MTLSTLRKEIWQMTGEPSDLDPSTDVQYGGAPLLNFVVNEGTRQIASWKDPVTGRQLLFPFLIEEMFFEMAPLTGTLDADGTDESTIIFPVGFGSQDDQYTGWVLEIGGEQRYIVSYVGSTLTATTLTAFSSIPLTGDDITLYKRFAYVLPSSDPRASEHITAPSSWDFLMPLKISDITNKRAVEPAPRIEDFITTFDQVSQITQWGWRSGKLDFNAAPQSATWFKMEYYRGINEITLDTEEPEIPKIFHYGIVLWGIWWGLRRQGSSPDAYSAKQDFVEFMRNTMSIYDMQNIRSEDYGVVEVGT